MPATSAVPEFSMERARVARSLDAFCAHYLPGVDAYYHNRPDDEE